MFRGDTGILYVYVLYVFCPTTIPSNGPLDLLRSVPHQFLEPPRTYGEVDARNFLQASVQEVFHPKLSTDPDGNLVP